MEADKEVDRYYEEKRNATQALSDQDTGKFFPGYQTILRAMFPVTEKSLLNSKENLRVLDVCMAPGGFTHTILAGSENAFVTGASLPPEAGGSQDACAREGESRRICCTLSCGIP